MTDWSWGVQGTGPYKQIRNVTNGLALFPSAWLVVLGRVALAGTPVKLQADGSFSARLSMPDRRQVLPVVASSPDGVEQRTVVLAVERNTKVMEPKIRDSSSED